MVRHPGPGPADRRHQLRRQPGHGHGRGRKEKALHRNRRRQLGPHQCQLHALHHPLRLRHRGPGQRHRRGSHQGRWQELVFPDRRLRLRPGPAGRHPGRRHQDRRHGQGQRQAPAQRQRLLQLFAAGPGLGRADTRPGQCRWRHHQRGQGRQRVRHHQGHEAGRPADVHQRCALARPEDHRGHVPDRQLVLEPDPRGPRLEPPLLRENEAHALVAAGRRLLGRHALPEGGRRDQDRRRRQGHRADEGHADQGLLHHRHHPQGRRPRHPRHVSDAGEVAQGIHRAVGLLQGRGQDPGRGSVHQACGLEVPAGEEMTHPLPASPAPSRGRTQRPGKAGSAGAAGGVGRAARGPSMR
mmetsp:Transcript_59740/g.146746  ORF Transcript_59740/g.146746 Transcript_59740/m.146746 type:complete len:354 (+) Transcript_59740:162-1223(+)